MRSGLGLAPEKGRVLSLQEMARMMTAILLYRPSTRLSLDPKKRQLPQDLLMMTTSTTTVTTTVTVNVMVLDVFPRPSTSFLAVGLLKHQCLKLTRLQWDCVIAAAAIVVCAACNSDKFEEQGRLRQLVCVQCGRVAHRAPRCSENPPSGNDHWRCLQCRMANRK